MLWILWRIGHKAADCPIKKSNQNKGSKSKNEYKKKQSTKGDHKGKGHKDMSKIICFMCVEYGHYAQDCLKAHNNANMLKKVSKTRKSRICWIWTMLV